MTMDDKLTAILNGSVDDAKPQLAGLTREELTELHDGEEASAKRSTMLAAIHSELRSRGEPAADDAGAGAVDGAAQADTSGAAAKVYTQAEWDARENAHRDAVAWMFNQSQVDQMLAEQKARDAAEKDRVLSEAQGNDVAVVDIDVAEPLELNPKAMAPGLFATTTASQIVFVDDQDRPIASIPAMPFEPKDFEPNGGAVTLVREVEFPKELPIADVSGAFLLNDDGDACGKATLVMPFSIGGGRNAKLAKSSLQFAA
jgi:hypothetical protein